MREDQIEAMHLSCQSVQPVFADGPYPPVEVEGPNLQYARMLAIDFASGKSEMTSVTQYVYQSWVLAPQFAEVAETMHCIAMVEMHHLDILGNLITLLGGNPQYYAAPARRPMVWNGNMVNYSQTVAMAMRQNMALEKAAIDTYRRQAAVIQDAHIVAILNRIIQDEDVHMRIFRKYLDAAF